MTSVLDVSWPEVVCSEVAVDSAVFDFGESGMLLGIACKINIMK